MIPPPSRPSLAPPPPTRRVVVLDVVIEADEAEGATEEGSAISTTISVSSISIVANGQSTVQLIMCVIPSIRSTSLLDATPKLERYRQKEVEVEVAASSRTRDG